MAVGHALLSCVVLWLISSALIIFVDQEVQLNDYETILNPNSLSFGPVLSKPLICASILKPNTRASIPKCRGKRFLGGRVLYTANGTATFQFERSLLLSGDIATNPGPTKKKSTPKYPCRECNRAVRNNEDAILCASCGIWSHVKCLQMSRSCFQYYLDWPNIDWTCNFCALPKFSDSFFLDNSTSDCNASTESMPNLSNTDELDSLSWYQSKISNYYKFNLKIGYLNINSIINKMDEVKEMLNRNMFDILFIAETKIDKSVSSALVSHPGYRITRRDRAKGAGGMLAYMREDLSVYRRKKLEPTDIEAICLDISDNNKSRFMVCGCYRSPGKCKETDFLTSLSSAAEIMFRSRQELLLIGDMNMDMYSNEDEDRFPNSNLADFCQRFCLVNKITEPTRVTDKTKTLIDVILTSHQERYSTAGSLSLGVSDHDLVFIVRKNKLVRPKPRLIEFRSMKNFDHSKFLADLKKVPWDTAYLYDNADDVWEHWSTLYKDILDQHAPIKKSGFGVTNCPGLLLKSNVKFNYVIDCSSVTKRIPLQAHGKYIKLSATKSHH